jgi:hypothetical protein
MIQLTAFPFTDVLYSRVQKSSKSLDLLSKTNADHRLISQPKAGLPLFVLEKMRQ